MKDERMRLIREAAKVEADGVAWRSRMDRWLNLDRRGEFRRAFGYDPEDLLRAVSRLSVYPEEFRHE